MRLKLKDLKKMVNALPSDLDHLDVWIYDTEGSLPFTLCNKVLAYDAGLNMEEMNDEYINADDLSPEEIDKLLADGYVKVPNILRDMLSKEIIYIR